MSDNYLISIYFLISWYLAIEEKLFKYFFCTGRDSSRTVKILVFAEMLFKFAMILSKYPQDMGLPSY